MEKKVKDIEKEVEDIDIDDDYEEISVEERIIGIEKKVNIILIIVALVAAMSLFTLILSINKGGSDNDTNTNSSSESDTGYDTSAFKEISASDIQSGSKNETIVVWIGRQGCGYCAAYAPNIAQAGKNYGIEIRYVDLGKMLTADATGRLTVSDTESWDLITNLTGSGDWKTFAADNMGATPLTLIIKNNKVVGGLNSYTDVSSIESAFDDAGIKK